MSLLDRIDSVPPSLGKGIACLLVPVAVLAAILGLVWIAGGSRFVLAFLAVTYGVTLLGALALGLTESRYRR